MRIVVTGGEGFIGSHLVWKLRELGFEVFSFDKNKTSLSCDITNYAQVEDYTRNTDIVFHLAAIKSHELSWFYPKSAVDTNVIGTLNILEAARKNAVSKVVYASSCEVYGNQPSNQPLTEEAPLMPLSPYSATKVACEALCRSYYHTYGLPTLIVRQFNIIGANAYAGQFDAVIPKMLYNHFNHMPIHIYGNGKQTRSFLDIEDLIDFYVSILTVPYPDVGPINVGSDEEISINDLVLKIHNYENKNKEIKVMFLPKRKCEIQRFVCDYTKASRFGWKPTVSFDESFKRVYQFAKHDDSYKVK